MKTLRKLLDTVLNELYDQIEESERYYNWYLEEKDKNILRHRQQSHIGQARLLGMAHPGASQHEFRGNT